MMSKKQWFVLLCIYMAYLIIGATVFHVIESRAEAQRMIEETKQKEDIEVLLQKNYVGSQEQTTSQIFYKISEYCNKPLGGYVPEEKRSNLTWTFYHAVFFVLTIVSTIGYGNLSPTTPFTRVFMILFGLVGIPLNGMVIITLGDFFGMSFLKLYQRWKTAKVERAVATIGLIGKVMLYLIPGMMLFIFIPSTILVLYEEWSFDIAIEFAFATLTTIGVGRHVPGTRDHGSGKVAFAFYRVFLLFWIITGLGYLAMIFGFISRGLQSKRIHAIEHKIASNIKKTNRKIRQELRSVLNEYLLMRVERVYRERRTNVVKCCRTQSCPELRLGRAKQETHKTRTRSCSEHTKQKPLALVRIQSDTNLHSIDKERTFRDKDPNESSQFLLKVANALGKYDSTYSSSSTLEDGNKFDQNCENDIESYWADNNKHNKKICTTNLGLRRRAVSESKKDKADRNVNIFGYNLQHEDEEHKSGKMRSNTLPSLSKPSSLFTKLRNSIKSKGKKQFPCLSDMESQSSVEFEEKNEEVSSTAKHKNQLLEETSLADFLRALHAVDDIFTAKEKDTAIKASKRRRLPITPTITSRKISLIPSSPSHNMQRRRRFSLHTVNEISTTRHIFAPPLASITESHKVYQELVRPARNSNIIQERRQSINPSYCIINIEQEKKKP